MVVKTVLIVDDNPSIRYALRAFLRGSTQMRICGEAADGTQAINTALELHPDLVLLDFAMPGMNGVEAASVLKHRLPETRIVIFTLYADQIGDSLANALGIDLVVSKSEGGAALARALQPLLR